MVQAKKNALTIENFLFFDHFKWMSVFKAMMPAFKEPTIKNERFNPKAGDQFSLFYWYGIHRPKNQQSMSMLYH